MTSLADLTLRTSYHKGRDDIAEAFYLPCMRRASAYDRAVGYFRSTVFIIAWPALRAFVARGGRMRVLCSQVLASADIEALRSGYAARENDVLASRLLAEVRSLLAEPALREPARILAALVAGGQLELKVALLREGQTRAAEGRIFHDKLGIFRDDQGNAVIFKGSMNETWTGLASDGNLESIDVAATWMGARDLERAKTEDAYFNDLWRNQYPTLDVLPFPQVAHDEFIRAADPNWEKTVEELAKPAPSVPETRTLRPHQAAVLASWAANDRRGIVQLATGSGKTFVAITAISEALRRHDEVAIVIVPDRALFQQWERELAPLVTELDAHLLRAGAGHDGWRKHLRLWTRPDADKRRLVLATVQTASSDDFMNGLARGPHVFLVADEVHRLGSPHHQRILEDAAFGARLGLSATPERAGDPAGTTALLTFFRGVLEPRYALADAVRDGVLTRYFYRPHVVSLADDEIVGWRDLTTQVARLQARIADGAGDPGLELRVKHLLMQRAHIIKQARAKVPLAEQVLQAEYHAGQRWIVYCDDQAQLNSVSRGLTSIGVPNTVFHAQMTGDRTETLRWLDRQGGVVIAIKCLDEGVDVPSVTHAMILASSKNPREFIQRRGRVLRRAPFKALAYVHDAIVVPPAQDDASDEQPMDAIAVGELARAIEFAMGADNPASATDLQKIAIDVGLNWQDVASNGVEDAD